MANPDPLPPAHRRFSMLDLVAMTVGFALAAMLLRIFWGAAGALGGLGVALLLLVYLWLGLCMSGPVVLLLERREHPSPPGLDGDEALRPPPGRSVERRGIAGVLASRYTRCERAWMSIGGYWIGATAFLLPGLMHDMPLLLLLILQVAALAGLWAIVPRRRPPALAERAWTHRLAAALLVTWPLVWAASIYLAIGIRR
ncbi:MAG: hypothetical protein U0800_05265 [Isosphaeraceae bacterium]